MYSHVYIYIQIVVFAGHDAPAEAVLNPKKNIWEKLQVIESLYTDMGVPIYNLFMNSHLYIYTYRYTTCRLRLCSTQRRSGRSYR